MSAVAHPAPAAPDASFAVVRRALAEARAALGMDVAYFAEFVGGRSVLRVVEGPGCGLREGDPFPPEERGHGRPEGACEPRWLADASAMGLGAYLGVPLRRADGTLHGTIGCAAERPVPQLGPRDAAMLGALAGVVASHLEHEHRYHQVLEQAAEPVWVTDLEGETVFGNEALARLLGEEREALVGRSALDFLVPGQRAVVDEATAQRQAGRMSRYEVDLRRADGTVVPVSVEGAPLTDDHGATVGRVATLTDLSARREAERLAEARFRWLAELVDHQVWVAGPNGHMHFVNGRVTDYFGPPAADWSTTAAFLVTVHPDDAAHAAAVSSQAWDSGEEIAYEARLRRHDGVYRPHRMRAFPVRDAAGAVVRWYGVSTDETELQAQERLLRSEASLREAQAIAQVGSYEREMPDGPMRFSAELLRMLELTEEEFGGSEAVFLSRVHPDDREGLAATIASAEAACSSFTTELRLRLPSRAERLVFARGGCVAGADGRPRRSHGTVQDVTEQRAAQAAQRGRAEAERASRAKSEFLSRMSHELRTPLNAILGFGQLLELEALTADQRDSVGHILKGGAHLLELINEVLEISRIEAGALRLSLEAVELGPVVRDVVALVAPLAVERGVAVEVRADAEGWVRADVGRLKQVVLNLLSNAIKFNRPGGLVTVRLRASAVAGRLRLVVSDTGPGLTPDEVARAFDPFERLHAQDATEGTGLGLTLSRSLAEAMGGTLTARSEPGCGADFTLELAEADPGIAKDATRAPGLDDLRTAHGAQGGCRVLCVEDNPSNLRLVERVLGRAGVQVLGAPQGQLGLELARRYRPDVVLLDLDLPDGPGEHVLAQLAADPATARIPVVVCSADASAATIERLQAAGAREYLTKPLDVGRLLKTVARMADVKAT